jgi:hypothetical protein
VPQRFADAIGGWFSVPALKSAEELTFRIRASLQLWRKFFENQTPL